MDRALIIFIKNPEAGKVKTRLAKDIGNENALTIYKHLLAHTRKIAIGVKANRHLFYDDSISLKDDWPEIDFKKFVQQGDDLGLRMFNAFEKAFLNSQKVIIIGSDCMELTPDIIEKAFLELNNHDFVIGPANDGGYYLLGMKYTEQSFFQGKAWSTDSVYRDTVANISNLSKSLFILPLLSDVDTIADLSPELKILINLY